jgi:hypothetical protein
VQQSSEWRDASSEEWTAAFRSTRLPGFNFGEGQVAFCFAGQGVFTLTGSKSFVVNGEPRRNETLNPQMKSRAGLCLPKTRKEDRTLHYEAPNPACEFSRYTRSLSRSRTANTRHRNTDVLNGPSPVGCGRIDAAARLRGDAVVAVVLRKKLRGDWFQHVVMMQAAETGVGNDAMSGS